MTPSLEPSLKDGRYEEYQPETSGADSRKLIEDDKECRILGARKMQEISRRFIRGKGIGRFRQLQEDLMREADVLVAAGIMSYDKIIEKVTQLEEHIGEHGGNESETLDPQDRLRAWLNTEDSSVERTN